MHGASNLTHQSFHIVKTNKIISLQRKQLDSTFILLQPTLTKLRLSKRNKEGRNCKNENENLAICKND